ncbi:MAG: hypothetical protein K2X26_11700 [Chitinophagaceae bacterium]|jgi:hypothetical protein|nr:hypothetical protein [Chitinophagaceae bacterium]
MLKFLKLNTALLFILITAPWVVNLFFENQDYRLYVSIFANTILLLWFFSLDAELTKRIPSKIRPSNTMFILNSVLIYLGNCIAVIFLEPQTSFTVTGIAALPFLYIFYALFSIFSHLSKILTYAEEEKEIPTSKRIGEMFSFFFFIVGIWWLQPRIQAVLSKPPINI